MRLSELSGDGELIARVAQASGPASWVTRQAGRWYPLNETLSELCAAGVTVARQRIADATTGRSLDHGDYVLLPPIDSAQEVWAAGVTYERSRIARIEESGAHDLYASVYDSARPELFFKASGRRVVGAGGAIGVRADAHWSVPEPELAVVFDSAGDVLGFSIGDDVSSRDIEATNALYLPQAKVYDRSCSLGPGIVPVWALAEAPRFEIELEIARVDEVLFEGATSTERLHRHWLDLGRWLRSCLTFDDGVILLTGTGIVPGDDVSLTEGDQVVVRISGLGELRNTVQTSGVAVPA
jgi:2-dehydro-3-deoxy-D-arabinonate dehydratase